MRIPYIEPVFAYYRRIGSYRQAMLSPCGFNIHDIGIVTYLSSATFSYEAMQSFRCRHPFQFQLVEERCYSSYLNQCVNRHMWNVSHALQIIGFSLPWFFFTILFVAKRVYVFSRRRRPADRAFAWYRMSPCVCERNNMSTLCRFVFIFLVSFSLFFRWLAVAVAAISCTTVYQHCCPLDSPYVLSSK